MRALVCRVSSANSIEKLIVAPPGIVRWRLHRRREPVCRVASIADRESCATTSERDLTLHGLRSSTTDNRTSSAAPRLRTREHFRIQLQSFEPIPRPSAAASSVVTTALRARLRRATARRLDVERGIARRPRRAVLHEPDAGRVLRALHQLRDASDAHREPEAHRHARGSPRRTPIMPFEQHGAAGEHARPRESCSSSPVSSMRLRTTREDLFDARLDDVDQHAARDRGAARGRRRPGLRSLVVGRPCGRARSRSCA